MGAEAAGPASQGLSTVEQHSARLQTRLGSLNTGLQGVSRTLGRELVTGLQRVALGLGAATAAAGFFGLKSASSFEQSAIAFETLLGSQEKGQALFKTLQGLNVKTPFQLSEITSSTQLLLRYGVAADQVVGVLKSLMDAAALSGNPAENLNRLSLATGQVISQGRLLGQDARQLAESGINAYALMGEKLHITAAEARDLGEAGKLSSQMFMEGLVNMEGPLAKMRGGAERMGTTVMGQLSNVKDALSVGLADAAKPLVDQLHTLIGTPDHPGALLSGLSSLVGTLGPPIFSLLGQIVGGIGELVPVIEPVLGAIVTGVGRLLTALGPLGPALEPVVGKLSDSLVRLVDALVPVMPDLVDAFVGLVLVLPAFVDLLTDLVPLTTPILRLITGLLSIGPVRGLVAGVLMGLLAYRAVSGVIGGLRAFADMLGLIAVRTVAVNEAQAAGAIPGAAGAAGRANLGMLAGIGGVVGGGALAGSGMLGNRGRATAGGDLKTVGGFAVMGAGLGSIIPGAGTVAGGLLGAGVGGVAVGLHHLMGDPRGTLGRSLSRHSGVEASTPGSRAITSSLRTFGLSSGDSGHLSGSSLDLSGPFLNQYAANLRASGGWSTQHDAGSGYHLHGEYGDARPTAMGAGARLSALLASRGGPLVHIDTVNGVEDFERSIRRVLRDVTRDDHERGRQEVWS